MEKVGIVSINEDEFLFDRMKSEKYESIKVSYKDQLELFDLIVISVPDESYFRQACDWLITIKKQINGFVLIYEEECGLRNRELYYYLGANIVIDQKERIEELKYIIINYFSGTDNSVKEKKVKNASLSMKLNKANRSIKLIDTNKKWIEIDLTRLEFQVVEILYNKLNQTVSYEEIHNSIFRETEIIRKDRVANIISRLRRKLGSNRSHYISTINAKGYRLVITEPK